MPLSAELIQKISSLDIKDLLALLLAGKLTREGINYIKKKIKERWAEKRYGFTPNPEEAATIYKIGQKEYYKRLKDCIGNHWSLYLIRLGLYISDLNDEGRRKVIKKVKDGVYKKYGEKGLKITHMATTGVLPQILEYLSELKIRENLNRVDLAIRFDKIIERWYDTTFFVKKEDTEKEISRRVVTLINKNFPIIFVFAYGPAYINATKIITKLSSNEIISKKGYRVSMTSRKDGAGGILYTWIFELVKS